MAANVDAATDAEEEDDDNVGIDGKDVEGFVDSVELDGDGAAVNDGVDDIVDESMAGMVAAAEKGLSGCG